ncbi:hypothetical protein [Shewanella woodyi]|uniref:hypothetical protein n=1 Tax=Shewanella woodyi TaxID=60961 RepID=UPI003749DE6B
MASFMRPNCWSKMEREKVEAHFYEIILNWSFEWFLEPRCQVLWHWNSNLFSCASQNVEVNERQWLNLAHYAITGKNLTAHVTKKLSLLADKMQDELCQSCGVALSSNQQYATMIEVRLYNDLVFHFPLSTDYMPRTIMEESGPFPEDMIDKMVGDECISLQSSLESFPMNLDEINSLKSGDRIMLQHRCDSEVVLFSKTYKTKVSGFLASVMGNRAIVVK